MKSVFSILSFLFVGNLNAEYGNYGYSDDEDLEFDGSGNGYVATTVKTQSNTANVIFSTFL